MIISTVVVVLSEPAPIIEEDHLPSGVHNCIGLSLGPYVQGRGCGDRGPPLPPYL